MWVFTSTLLLLGACVPSVAKINGYRNLMDMTKGTFMIGSTGKSYHDSIHKYSREPIGW